MVSVQTVNFPVQLFPWPSKHSASDKGRHALRELTFLQRQCRGFRSYDMWRNVAGRFSDISKQRTTSIFKVWWVQQYRPSVKTPRPLPKRQSLTRRKTRMYTSSGSCLASTDAAESLELKSVITVQTSLTDPVWTGLLRCVSTTKSVTWQTEISTLWHFTAEETSEVQFWNWYTRSMEPVATPLVDRKSCNADHVMGFDRFYRKNKIGRYTCCVGCYNAIHSGSNDSNKSKQVHRWIRFAAQKWYARCHFTRSCTSSRLMFCVPAGIHALEESMLWDYLPREAGTPCTLSHTHPY